MSDNTAGAEDSSAQAPNARPDKKTREKPVREKKESTGGRLTFAAVASTLSAAAAVIGTSWFNAARLNIDQANLAMSYAEFVSQPEKPSLEDKAFVAKAMSTAGFTELAAQVSREARDAQLRAVSEQQLNQKVHASLNIGIPDLTVGQLETIMTVIQLAETGRVSRDYGLTTSMAGDAGVLNYGIHQASLTSGNLHKVIDAYVSTPGARDADALRPYLGALQAKDKALSKDDRFKDLLKQAGDDPVMATAQIEFFLRIFYGKAFERVRSMGFRSPLSFAVVADSHIQGSFELIAKRATAAVGEPRAGNEKQWIAAYVAARKEWFANHPNQILRNMVPRMETYERLIAADNWQLALPFAVVRPGGEVVLQPEDIQASALVRANTDAILAEILATGADAGPGFFEKLGAGMDGVFGLKPRPAPVKPQAEQIVPAEPAGGAAGASGAIPH